MSDKILGMRYLWLDKTTGTGNYNTNYSMIVSIPVILISSRYKPLKNGPFLRDWYLQHLIKISFFANYILYLTLFLLLLKLKMSTIYCSLIWNYKRPYTGKSENNATNNQTILKTPTEKNMEKKLYKLWSSFLWIGFNCLNGAEAL